MDKASWRGAVDGGLGLHCERCVQVTSMNSASCPVPVLSQAQGSAGLETLSVQFSPWEMCHVQ